MLPQLLGFMLMCVCVYICPRLDDVPGWSVKRRPVCPQLVGFISMCVCVYVCPRLDNVPGWFVKHRRVCPQLVGYIHIQMCMFVSPVWLYKTQSKILKIDMLNDAVY